MPMVEKRKRIFNSYYTFDKMKKQFKPTDKSIIAETIGRNCAKEFTQRNPPQFEVDLKTSRTPFVAFMHSIVKGEFRRF